MHRFSRSVRKHFSVVLIMSSLAPLGAWADNALTIPPEVESEARTIEAKFNSVLDQECGAKTCTPTGCVVTSFHTLDEKQDSSLPGLDESDESQAPLQYKLASLRCEFAHEPTLSNEAVNVLRQRVADKVRTAGVSLNIQARKLSAALNEAPKAIDKPAASPFQTTGAVLALIAGVTAAALALIWALRRLGKPRPVEEVIAEQAEKQTAASDEPNAFALIEKKERLQGALTNPALAAAALQPLIAKNEPADLCRVLKHFGPAPLVSFVDQPQNRDLFAAVHTQYEEDAPKESNTEMWQFLERVERLVTLAQLGRPEGGVQEELNFLGELAPDEFTELVQGLTHDELMAVLSFVPLRLRAHYLQQCDERQVEAYAQHILKYPRLSEQAMRRLAATLKTRYSESRGEIKKVSRDQVQQLEQLLNNLSGPRRTQLLSRVRKETPELLNRLTSEVVLDGAVVHAPVNVLNEVFLELDPSEGAAYLQSHPDREAILRKLNVSLGQSLTKRIQMRGEKLDFVESESDDLERTRHKLNEIMKSKSLRGEINLRSMNEAVVKTL